MFKLDLEKAEEPEIKLPTSVGSSKKQESSKKISISALLTMPKLLTVWIIEKAIEYQKNTYFCFIDYTKARLTLWITTNWKILKENGIPDHLTCVLKNLKQVRKQQLELDMEQQTGSK